MQVAHVAVLAKSGVARIENALAALSLIFKRANVRGQQPMQPKRIALLLRKRCALVEPRIEQQIDAVQAGVNDGNIFFWGAGGDGL